MKQFWLRDIHRPLRVVWGSAARLYAISFSEIIPRLRQPSSVNLKTPSFVLEWFYHTYRESTRHTYPIDGFHLHIVDPICRAHPFRITWTTWSPFTNKITSVFYVFTVPFQLLNCRSRRFTGLPVPQHLNRSEMIFSEKRQSHIWNC